MANLRPCNPRGTEQILSRYLAVIFIRRQIHPRGHLQACTTPFRSTAEAAANLLKTGFLMASALQCLLAWRDSIYASISIYSVEPGCLGLNCLSLMRNFSLLSPISMRNSRMLRSLTSCIRISSEAPTGKRL